MSVGMRAAWDVGLGAGWRCGGVLTASGGPIGCSSGLRSGLFWWRWLIPRPVPRSCAQASLPLRFVAISIAEALWGVVAAS